MAVGPWGQVGYGRGTAQKFWLLTKIQSAENIQKGISPLIYYIYDSLADTFFKIYNDSLLYRPDSNVAFKRLPPKFQKRILQPRLK